MAKTQRTFGTRMVFRNLITLIISLSLPDSVGRCSLVAVNYIATHRTTNNMVAFSVHTIKASFVNGNVT